MKLFLPLAFVLLSLATFAQKSTDDIILKLNGDEMIGKVTEMNDDNVKFTYKGETIIYTVKKSDILKITFASGRIEFINKPTLPSESNGGGGGNTQTATAAPKVAPALEDHHNKVAILPFRFIADRQKGDEEIGYRVQDEAFAYLSKHSAGLELQPTTTTNALLLKAGVTFENERAFTPVDICNILGVEYFLQGTVSQSRAGAISTQSGSASNKTNYNSGKSGNDTKSTLYGSSTAITTETFKTSVTMNVFNDKGSSLFSQSHDAFFNTESAYRNTLQYLLKRTPLYRK
jgi:hypothetical protein